MKIQPKKEDELNSFSLLPDGEYPFTVLESDEIPSKSVKNKGRMMFAVKLNVHGPNGDRHVYDYFADWFSEWKLRHFCHTVGILDKYEAGDVDGRLGAFNGRTGYVKIKTGKPQGNYAAKNEVEDYVYNGAVVSKGTPAGDDDVPF